MDHHAMQFIVEAGLKLRSIFFDTINTDEYVAGDHSIFCVVESDDVCVSIVVQMLDIDLKEFVVGAEYIGNIASDKRF